MNIHSIIYSHEYFIREIVEIIRKINIKWEPVQHHSELMSEVLFACFFSLAGIGPPPVIHIPLPAAWWERVYV